MKHLTRQPLLPLIPLNKTSIISKPKIRRKHTCLNFCKPTKKIRFHEIHQIQSSHFAQNKNHRVDPTTIQFHRTSIVHKKKWSFLSALGKVHCLLRVFMVYNISCFGDKTPLKDLYALCSMAFSISFIARRSLVKVYLRTLIRRTS